MSLPDQCPLCQASRDRIQVQTVHVYGDRDGTRAFFHCRQCDVRFLFPGLSPAEEAEFYASEFETFMEARAGNDGGWKSFEGHVRANQPTRARRMKYLAEHVFPGAAVLEIGCSSGFMIIPLAQSGHDCVGIEPSGYFRDYVTRQGIEVHSSIDGLRSAHPRRRFDVVLHFFVLEHVAKPLEFIQAQLEWLKPGGKIIFEIPNVADPLCSVYDIPAFERFYWSVAHCWYFSDQALRFLLDRIGQPYRILLDQRYDLSNHLIWARDGKPGGMGRFTARLGDEVEELYKQALIRNGHCDTLIGIITKSAEGKA